MNRIFLVLCVILLIVCPLAFAQNLGTGLYAFGSFDSRGFDTVNIGNLNTHFEIPIVSKTGRGLPFSYSLVYDGLIWSPSTTTGTGTWVADPNWGFHGQLLGGAAYSGYLTYSSLSTSCPRVGSRNIFGNLYTNYVYHDPYGKNHRFNYSLKSCPLTDPGDGTVTGNGSSSDGSGLTYNLSDFKVHTRNGTIISAPTYSGPGSPSNGSITDSNGNVITNNGNGTFTDTTGNTALTVGGSGTPASPTTFTYPVAEQANGASTAAATLAYKAYTVQTNFQCSGITESGATSVNLVDHISLADGSTYSFAYELTPGVSGAVTGRLASITLPTSGTISYSYIDGCNGSGMNADGTVGSLTRTTSDGVRTYTRAPVPNNANATTTTLQDEKGNNSVYQFSTTSGFAYETHRSAYTGAVGGALLQDVFTCYNGAVPPCDGAAMTQPITQTNSLTSYNGGSQLSVVNTYDSVGSLTSSTQGPPTGTALIVQSTLYNLLEEPNSVTTKDGSGNFIALTTYGYDETTPTATSGISQHVVASGTRGNQTSSHIQTGGSTIDTATTYYDTGVPITVTTPNGTTQYGYDPTQTFVESTTLPTPPSGVSLSTSAGFDSKSGAQLSSTGLNSGQTTQYTQYDGLLRPTIVIPPSGSGQVTIQYSPTQIGVVQAMSSGPSTSAQTLLDAYGRKSRVAVYNGQSSNPWYQTDYCYDATGLLQFQSSQYQGNGWGTPKQCSGNGTSYTYDALGRVTSSTNSDGTSSTQYSGRAVLTTDVNGVQKITQYDLLGRISSICEISGNSYSGIGHASCASDIAGSGFLTKYAYSLSAHTTTITQDGQTRTFVTDEAGRPTSVTEPERGTTTYSYMYNVPGQPPGLQVVRTRPRANQTNASVTTTTTTQYDDVGRPVSVVYNDGTLPKYFGYDTPTGWGFAQTYIKGQLTTAFEGSSPSAAATALSYDAMGRLNAVQSCEPSVCAGTNSFRPVRSFGYDLAGNLTSSSDGVSGAIVYGRSPAGEVTSITNQTYPQTHVSNVVNGPAGPISYSLGNGLNVYTAYDTMDRAYAQWLCAGPPAYSCGNQIYGTDVYLKGSRVWASDDTIIGPGTIFGYDEFNRLNSANYGNGTTTFAYTYDRWGNRTSQSAPQGGPAPSFSYNVSNNQIQNQGITYDAAGNLTNDGVHSYSYDAEGNLMSADGFKYVYDAFNRRVSQQTSSGTYEYLYDPTGKRTSRWNANWGDEGRIYWDGRQIAFRAEDGSTYYEHQNLMGTERARTNSAGSIVSTYSSLPWGDGYTPPPTPPYSNQDTLHYAQLDHDSESGTEHAQFRQLSSTQGRWMSPDPYDGSYDPTNPQSLNRYAYVLNNPLAFTDPSGQQKPRASTDTNDGGEGLFTYGNGYSGTSSFGSSWNEFQSYYAFTSPDATGPPRVLSASGVQQTEGSDPSNNVDMFGNVHSSLDGGIGGNLVNWVGSWGLIADSLNLNAQGPNSIGSVLTTPIHGPIQAPNPYITHYIRAYAPAARRTITGDPACYFAPDAVSAIHSLQQGNVEGPPQASTDGEGAVSINQNTTAGARSYGNQTGYAGAAAGAMIVDGFVSIQNCLQGR